MREMISGLQEFARFTYLVVCRSGSVRARSDRRRTRWLALFYLVFPVLEAVTWLCFALDDLLWGGYRRQTVERPVFIVGNLRSGTTYLHRLMARDERNFTSMQLWEILFAPSVVQRKIGRALHTLDRWLGGPLSKRIVAIEEGWVDQRIRHRVTLRSPEEDEFLMLHIWSSLAVWLYAALLQEARPYAFFDTEMPPVKRERIMRFYARCLQRHLYAHRGKHYLSKNPCFSARVSALYERFPDAKIVCLVRSPLQVLPSYLSFMEYAWRAIGNPADDSALREYVLNTARHWYRHPLERLSLAPADSYAVIRYDDLATDPQRVIGNLYDRLGFEISPQFARTLREETEKARGYRSTHRYSLEQHGLIREQILAEYRDIFERFGFVPPSAFTAGRAGHRKSAPDRTGYASSGLLTSASSSRSTREPPFSLDIPDAG